MLSKVAAIDDLGVLQEERSMAPRNIETIEAQLRSEIFEKERANDRVRNTNVDLMHWDIHLI